MYVVREQSFEGQAMTPATVELLKRIKEMAEFDEGAFGKWWFLYGGGLHRMWKTRKYSDILEKAKWLPRQAAEQQHTQSAKLIDTLIRVIEKQAEALEFYGDKLNWDEIWVTFTDENEGDVQCKIDLDDLEFKMDGEMCIESVAGKRARQAQAEVQAEVQELLKGVCGE
jgi:hypothetical protein